MKKKILFICTAALFVLAALNLKLAFNNGLNINFSLASMEALARGGRLYIVQSVVSRLMPVGAHLLSHVTMDIVMGKNVMNLLVI